MDITFWNDPVTKLTIPILHIIDLSSRFSSARFLKSKQPKEIIEKLACCWISVFGPPMRTWLDNGGEFGNDIFVEFLIDLTQYRSTTSMCLFTVLKCNCRDMA